MELARRMGLSRSLFVLFLLDSVVLFHGVNGRNEYARLFDRCTAEKNTFECLKKRTLDILETAIEDDSVYVINDFISIGKDPAATARSNNQPEKSENSTELSLDQKLDNKFHEYLATRSIRLTIPGDAFEGRRRKNKGGYGGMMMAVVAVGGMLAQLAYGKIAFLAGTALLTAKMALVLSAIIGLKKLVGGGGGGGHEVIYATSAEHHGGGYGGGYSGGWQRTMEEVPPT